MAAPADVLRGELKGKPVEVLDADQDGLFGGEADYVRWAGGAYGPQRGPRRVLVEDAIATYEVRRTGGAWDVVLLPLARPDGTLAAEISASTHGRILNAPLGRGGFGYDPLFLFDEEGYPQSGKGFGEMGAAEKAQVSHRGRALRELARRLPGLVAGPQA